MPVIKRFNNDIIRANIEIKKGEKIGINLKKTVQEELAEYRENDKKSLDEMIDQIAGE